jgi:hypothetical protein
LALFEKIQSLKELRKARPGGILTIYLDTDRSKPEQQHGQWKVKLKNGLKKLEEYLMAQKATEERNRFAALAKKVEREILQLQRNHQKSLILFASDDLDLWELEILQVEVTSEFHWEEEVVLDQLEMINQEHPPCGMIVAQTDQVRILDIALGQVLDEINFVRDSDTEEWMEPKQLKPRLQKEAEKRGWKSVYFVGEPSVIDPLKSSLKHLPVMHTVPKNLKTESSHDLLGKVM